MQLRSLVVYPTLTYLITALLFNYQVQHVKAEYSYTGQTLTATVYNRCGFSIAILESPRCLIIGNGTIDEDNAYAVAWGNFTNTVNTTGWGTLVIRTAPRFDPEIQAYAAGYLEAFFTQDLIFQYWLNYAANEFNGTILPNDLLREFMSKQRNWVKNKMSNAPKSSKLWRGIRRVMAQLHGLTAGMIEYSDEPRMKNASFAEEVTYLLNAVGDFTELNEVFNPSEEVRKQIAANNALMTDCSALIRILPNNSDIIAGHTTWRPYYAMIRIYKVYDFAFASTASVASSPGLLHSKDDFYALGNGLVIMETTNNIYNKDLFVKHLKYQSLLSWQRVVAANWAASSGREWTSMFALYNSGTYNNQWMVLDTRRFKAGRSLPKRNLLWIIEQIPGFTETRDVTHILIKQRFWPSYNIPFFEKIYNMSGYEKQFPRKYGENRTYFTDARALIFARDAPKISSMEDAKLFMQYNDFENDPLSHRNPQNAISSRYDLNATKPLAFGGVDAKLTSANNIVIDESIRVEAISGPTHVQQPPFTWLIGNWSNVSHIGVPTLFNFDWITVKCNGRDVLDDGIFSTEKLHGFDWTYWRMVVFWAVSVTCVSFIGIKWESLHNALQYQIARRKATSKEKLPINRKKLRQTCDIEYPDESAIVGRFSYKTGNNVSAYV